MALFAPAPASAQLAEVGYGPDGLAFEPLVVVDGLTVSASGPGGLNVTRSYPGDGSAVFLIFDDNGDVLPDGVYTYRLTGSPALDADTRAAMATCREAADCDSVVAALRASGALPEEAEMVQTGTFAIELGYVVLPGDEGAAKALAEVGSGTSDQDVPTKDQVILDDLIVDGSLCVGFDCVNGEAFGFDTIRLKENNIRIKFEDTSNSASFPTNDWQITANDSSNGGAEKFSIDDITNGRTPFTIEGGTPSHSLYVDSGGRVGFGTNNPVVDNHILSGNTPTLRLEQDGSSGFTPQTWDVAGNEANFFIRDATNGSTLPFRIFPGASTSSLVIDGNDDVGIGAGTNPDAPLHVARSSGAAKLDILKLEFNGVPRIVFENSTSTEIWKMGMDNMATGATDVFSISLQGSGGNEMVINKGGRVRFGPGSAFVFDLDPAGNLAIAGTLSPGSSRDIKRDFAAIDERQVLASVRDLPITTWNYKADPPETRHMGPMAEDFYAAFSLGADDEHIATSDAASVALAAIKGLLAVIEEKDAQISALEARVAAVEKLVSRLAQGSGALIPAGYDRGTEVQP